MTTVICKSKNFCALDSLWSCGRGGHEKITDYHLRKYLIVDDEIHLFAGDSYPILFTQAEYSGVISTDVYVKLMSELNIDEQMSVNSLAFSDGELLHYSGDYYESLIHDGSGGFHAAQFYHYASKQLFYSDLGCNIEGAIQYACHKDPNFTGKPILKKTWSEPFVDELELIDDNYLRYLKKKTARAKEKANMAKANLKSPLRTSTNRNNAQRVTVASALKGAENRKQRVLAREIALKSKNSNNNTVSGKLSIKTINHNSKKKIA